MTLSEGEVWLLIGALVLMTATMKAIGPAVVGGRDLPPWSAGVPVLAAGRAALLGLARGPSDEGVRS